MTDTFNLSSVKNHYDQWGAKQDSHAWYEDRALLTIREHMKLSPQTKVFELGCGTGRFAEMLFQKEKHFYYTANDLSSTMLALSRERLQQFRQYVDLREASPDGKIRMGDNSVDYFCSNFVLNVLRNDQLYMILHEAYRVTKLGGFLCLANVADGHSPRGKIFSLAWKAIQRIRPKLVGWCRPISMRHYLSPFLWEDVFVEQYEVKGVSVEVFILRKVEEKAADS